MSQYVEKNLTQGETIVLKGKLNPLALSGQIIWAIVVIVVAIVAANSAGVQGLAETAGAPPVQTILIVAGLVIGLLPFLVALIKLLSMSFCVTNKRVVGKIGVLKVNSLDLPINKVDNVQINATLLGRIFHYTNLTVKGSGDGTGVKFVGLTNGTQLKNAITEAIEQYADEARKAQAAEIAMAMSKGKN